MKSNSSENIVNINIIHEKVKNSSYCTTKAVEITQTTGTTESNDQLDYETFNARPPKIEGFVCEFSLMNFCSDDETQNEKESEIFYVGTNESGHNENERSSENRKDEETINGCEEEVYSLSQLYLNDNETVCTDKEQPATELMNVAEENKLMVHGKSLRVPFGVILRLIYPLTNGVVQGMRGIREVRFLKVIRSIASSRMALTNLLAYVANTISLNLSSVQVTNRIGPILKLLKIRIPRDGIESLPDSHIKMHGVEAFPDLANPSFSQFSREPRYSLPNFNPFSGKKLSMQKYEATKCCTLNILAEPPAGQPIRADIVFIHGLNGSLANTWKQGLWENERWPVEFQRPPKPPIRPPKRPRHSRTSAVHPSHHKKRARLSHADVCQRYSHERDSIDEADENNCSFTCSDFKDLQTCDGIEDSFPTFRLRMHDYGRLLQAEHDSRLQEADNKQNSTESPVGTNNNSLNGSSLNKKALKPSPNDPNYSKCWPGDWLPIDCPGVRVIALNYTTDPHLWRPVWKKKEVRSNLIQRSREMIELLIKHRVGYGQPIIWVGHSKGGLFIKQIIVDAWESGRPAAAPFWRSARGVFFYSVPHRGSHLASIRAPFLLRSAELIDVEKNNKYLLDLHRRFAGLYHLGHLKIEVFSFVETALTLLSVLYMRIVGVDSADPGIGDVCGIRLDHREICKPRSRNCILYTELVNMINKVS